MKLAVIGYGTIARLAMQTIAVERCADIEAVTILSRPDGRDRAGAMLEASGCRAIADAAIVTDAQALLARQPDIVLEAAGHEALNAFGAAVLETGHRLIITSVGALADNALRTALDNAATRGSSRYDIIPGAVGGLDILAAAKLSGLNRVVYKSRKPPGAWRGTAAETMTKLDAIREATVFFRGNAGEAARQFPQNANVAATIALAGAGFAATQVELIADPGVSRNVHELTVEAKSADFTIRIEGRPAPDNPKTSLTTAYSLARVAMDAMG